MFMKEFIEYIVKNLVDQPDKVVVSCHSSERGVVVEVQVAPEEVGKVVGSKGAIINAIRTIAMTISNRLGQGRIQIRLVD